MRCWSWKPDAPFLSCTASYRPGTVSYYFFRRGSRSVKMKLPASADSEHPLTNDFKSPIFCRSKHRMVNKQQRTAATQRADAVQKPSRFAEYINYSGHSHTLGRAIVDVPGQGFGHDMRCMASLCASACKVVAQGGPIVRMDAVLDNQRRTFTRRQSA
jgi:hypothetical protein